MKYIKTTYLDEITYDELDLENRHKILEVPYDDEIDAVWDYEEILVMPKESHSWAGEAQEIDVDLAITILQKLKKNGANYVEILHNSDHHGYNFYGLEMRLATPKEITSYKEIEQVLDNAEKEKKIAELQKEIAKLNKS